MRKHRLAERLLADVIGLEWEQVHIEACRWEHVMSDAVERRIVALVDKPLVCPHGNPIPGLEELGLPFAAAESTDPLLSLTEAAQTAGTAIIVDRISEQLQPDAGGDEATEHGRCATRPAGAGLADRRRCHGRGRRRAHHAAPQRERPYLRAARDIIGRPARRLSSDPPYRLLTVTAARL